MFIRLADQFDGSLAAGGTVGQLNLYSTISHSADECVVNNLNDNDALNSIDQLNDVEDTTSSLASTSTGKSISSYITYVPSYVDRFYRNNFNCQLLSVKLDTSGSKSLSRRKKSLTSDLPDLGANENETESTKNRNFFFFKSIFDNVRGIVAFILFFSISEMSAVEAKAMFPCLHIWKGVKGNLMYCKICSKYPGLVKQFAPSNRPPRITKLEGTEYRGCIVVSHMKTKYHLECVKRWRSDVEEVTDDSSTDLVRMISAANEKLANKIGGYAVTIYNDAKRLTLSAFSFPSRQLAFQIGQTFNINNPEQNVKDIELLNLQYLTPICHAEILECIVEVEQGLIEKKINDCLALSLRCDGSVDRTNIDKIYILAKLTNVDGKLETLFVGVGQQRKRGAEGLHETLKQTIDAIAPRFYETVVRKMSSFVTDGASVNIGDKTGLWIRLDADKVSYDGTYEILKIWCAAHRSDLIVKDLGKAIKEFQTVTSICSNTASHFNRAPMRAAELKEISTKYGIKLKSLPTMYEVRWCEYTHQLLDGILTSWECIIRYFEEKNDVTGKPYGNYLLNHMHLQMVAFMTDLLLVFKILQQRLQSDNLNPVSMQSHIKIFKNTISLMKNKSPLLGGWEERLMQEVQVENITSDDGDEIERMTWHGIELDVEYIERRGAARRVRTNDFVRAEILEKVLRLTDYRFEENEELFRTLGPFIDLDQNTDMKRVHELIGSDLELVMLNIQFNEISRTTEFKKLNIHQLILQLAAQRDSFGTVLTALARVAAATPHSADVERTISANNLLKTNIRSSLELKTENKYLFIHFNLPPLIEWNPRKSVIHWLNKKIRREHALSIGNSKRKSTQQRFFAGIFSKIDSLEIESFDSDDETCVQLHESKRRKR